MSRSLQIRLAWICVGLLRSKRCSSVAVGPKHDARECAASRRSRAEVRGTSQDAAPFAQNLLRNRCGTRWRKQLNFDISESTCYASSKEQKDPVEARHASFA